MDYTVLKLCTLKGKQFFIGDIVTNEYVDESSAKQLTKWGLIAPVSGFNDAAPDETLVNVPVVAEDGVSNIDTSVKDLTQLFLILQDDSAGAISQIEEVTSGEVLLLLTVMDSRKGIKAAAEKRAAVVFPESEPEPTTEESAENGASNA